ncbi:tetratricopeptide repeat protein [Gemmata sp. JC717]|uniref:tetratricopeptide repeat protein n=1 Tax=Gemmata algarum TaxID=2975278 RepID=UPI0021BAB5AD|nr:tetratricopeptide repeat protein [Gemmata algarum]MDY3553692.1 tetratricopeptide repeat protein [Gemmata algarum]
MVAALLIGAVLCPSAGPAPAATTDGHRDALARYGAAVWNLRRERLLTAARQLESAAKQDPEAAAPLRELAKLYAQLGRDPDAIRAARAVVARDPTDADTAALLARLLFDAGEPADALAAAKLALASTSRPERPDRAVRVYKELAALCERAQQLDLAERALRAALALVADGRSESVRAGAFTPRDADTEAAECFERLGHLCVKAGKFDRAIRAFESAAALYADPRRAGDAFGAARLGWNLSGALQKAGRPEPALKRLEEFLALKPQVPGPYQRAAELLRAANRPDDVVPALRRYLARDQENRALAAVLAAELAADFPTRREGDELFLSLTTYSARRNAEADPKVVAVQVKSHLDTGRARDIIADLDRTFVLLEDKDRKKDKGAAPTDAEKRFAADKARAVADALKEQPEGVKALLTAAADDFKAGTKRAYGTHHFIGTLAARHNQLDLAELQFGQAAREAPADAQLDALSGLIDVLWRRRRPDKVERVCRGAMDAQVLEVFFNFHLALALAEQGKDEEALKAADRCVLQAGDTDRLTVRLRKHRVLGALGRWDEAIRYGDALLDEFDAPADRQRIRYAQSGAYWAAKKPREAEAVLRAMLDDDADDASACNDLGYHLADQGRDLDEAERLVRRALMLDRIERRRAGSAEPESAAYRDSLGWVLFRRGKLKEARAELEGALALSEGATDPVAWDHLGDVLFRSGDKAGAREKWGRARELYEADLRLSSRGRRDGRLDEVKRKLARVPE